MKVTEKKDYWAECVVCGQRYKNWAGSTPCCGSLAFVLTEIHFRKQKINKLKNIISDVNKRRIY